MLRRNKKDKRAFFRLRAYHLVKFSQVSDSQKVMHFASLRDLSGGGGRLLTEKKLTFGEIIQIFVNYPSLIEPVSSLAKVVWAKWLPKTKKFEIGLNFLDLGDDIRKEIVSSIDKVRKTTRS